MSNLISSPPFLDKTANILSSPNSSIISIDHETQSNTTSTTNSLNLSSNKIINTSLAFKPEEVAAITRSHSRHHTIRGQSPPFSPTTPIHFNHQSKLKSIPISIPPTLRRPHLNQSISSLLISSTSDNQIGKSLELDDQLDWDQRTGRHELLTIKDHSIHDQTGGRDRWGNRWGMEGHVLSPVISERTEPTHSTSICSTISSQPSSLSKLISHNSLLQKIQTNDQQQTNLAPLVNSKTNQLHESIGFSSSKPFMNLKEQEEEIIRSTSRRSYSKTENLKRDLELSKRQTNKRIEKDKREKMVLKRDIILKEILKSPGDHKLIKSLGKLYLDSCNSLSGIKLSIHFLEQSIQLDNRDSDTWIELGKAWEKLYHEYPTEDQKEREQRLTNSSLGYRKSISLNPTSIQNRLLYSNYLSKLNKFREGALILQDAIEISNQDGKLWYELGRMMKNWGTSESIDKFERLRLSIEAFNKALELSPHDLYIKDALMDAKKVFELEVLEQEKRKQNDDVQVVKNHFGFKKLTSDMLVIPDFESLRHRQRNQTVQLDPNNKEFKDNHQNIQNLKQNESEPHKTVSPILKPLESDLDQKISPKSFSSSNKGKQREEVRSEERPDKSNRIDLLRENEIEKILLESNVTKNQQRSGEEIGIDQVITSPKKVNESIFELPMNLSTCT
ncbi:hypothetical protein CROQUDRAFT_299932 [Cronartium quercuum f. sp. fusiforme G11]|uniref:Uncharacterized protein n=1 Tax=Cronartium quercuum f. sp. fusiforme G11 TaxID=708437 RepID=A0A9P6NU27_9BASI|nr:hypothetical protein CROQUDRAFT_299932 [Cronartium quercuum f. sp. fusiforme G11]